MSIDELPLMLTVEEAAEVLRIGRNSAYAAVADGAIPSVRIGRTIRIPRTGLMALFREHDGSLTTLEDTDHALSYGSAQLLPPNFRGGRHGR